MVGLCDPLQRLADLLPCFRDTRKAKEHKGEELSFPCISLLVSSTLTQRSKGLLLIIYGYHKHLSSSTVEQIDFKLIRVLTL